MKEKSEATDQQQIVALTPLKFELPFWHNSKTCWTNGETETLQRGFCLENPIHLYLEARMK